MISVTNEDSSDWEIKKLYVSLKILQNIIIVISIR